MCIVLLTISVGSHGSTWLSSCNSTWCCTLVVVSIPSTYSVPWSVLRNMPKPAGPLASVASTRVLTALSLSSCHSFNSRLHSVLSKNPLCSAACPKRLKFKFSNRWCLYICRPLTDKESQVTKLGQLQVTIVTLYYHIISYCICVHACHTYIKPIL